MGEEGDHSPSDLNERRPVVCNTPDEEIFSNIRHATTLGLPWLQPSEPHEGIAVLVGGGPSVKRDIEEIRARHKAGQHVFALNGTLEWLAQKEIVAHSHVLLDARESNARFVRKAPRKTKYYIASQCHPSVFEALKNRDVTVWQPNYPGSTDIMGHIECAMIGGGTTVGMQAMSIAWCLGYRTLHLYGFDSSYERRQGHAYKQPENDGEQVHEFEVQGKSFIASNWMARQAEEFQLASKQLADGGAEIHVHGDGLLPWVAKCMEMPPANLACYDFSRAPSSYDFLTWLIIAEMNRRERGFDGPLKVAFKPGPKNGFRDDVLPVETEGRRQIFENVIRPSLSLIGAVESDDALEGCRYHYTMSYVGDAARRGIEVPRFRPTRYDSDRIDVFLEHLRGQRPIVITLREAEHWPQRNSNLESWLKFAEWVKEPVIFVRDTAKADQPLPFPTCPEASRDIGLRTALYARAKVNMFVSNGPGMIPVYSDYPYLMLKPLCEGYIVDMAEWWRKGIGVEPGSQFAWAKKNQRIAWCDDTFENIVSEWTRWRSE